MFLSGISGNGMHHLLYYIKKLCLFTHTVQTVNFSLNSINVFVFIMDTDCVLCEVRNEILLLEGGLCTYPRPINMTFGGQSSSGIGLPQSTSVSPRHY